MFIFYDLCVFYFYAFFRLQIKSCVKYILLYVYNFYMESFLQWISLARENHIETHSLVFK